MQYENKIEMFERASTLAVNYDRASYYEFIQCMISTHISSNFIQCFYEWFMYTKMHKNLLIK